jgi:solute carrier family 30 (zinc transporter), member 5/7
VEIVYEAIERLLSSSQMHRIGELLAVGAAGLAFNLVGIMVFDHAHHGHDHGHSHSHGNENAWNIPTHPFYHQYPFYGSFIVCLLKHTSLESYVLK